MGANQKNPVAGEQWMASGPYTFGFAITPSDSVALTTYTRAIYVGTTGNVKVDLVDGGTVTLNAVPVGLLQIVATKVYATGTTATNLIGLQ